MSLVKYLQNSISHGDFHFGRAELDGLPFKGNPALLKQDEVEERLVSACDAKNGTFSTGDPEQNARYLEILDKACNGWYKILFVDRWREPGDKHYHVYVEWVENYVMDRATRPIG